MCERFRVYIHRLFFFCYLKGAIFFMKYLLSGWTRYAYYGTVILNYFDSGVQYTDEYEGSVVAPNVDVGRSMLGRQYILKTGLPSRTKVILPDIISVKELSHGRLHTKLQEV